MLLIIVASVINFNVLFDRFRWSFTFSSRDFIPASIPRCSVFGDPRFSVYISSFCTTPFTFGFCTITLHRFHHRFTARFTLSSFHLRITGFTVLTGSTSLHTFSHLLFQFATRTHLTPRSHVYTHVHTHTRSVHVYSLDPWSSRLILVRSVWNYWHYSLFIIIVLLLKWPKSVCWYYCVWKIRYCVLLLASDQLTDGIDIKTPTFHWPIFIVIVIYWCCPADGEIQWKMLTAIVLYSIKWYCYYSLLIFDWYHWHCCCWLMTLIWPSIEVTDCGIVSWPIWWWESPGDQSRPRPEFDPVTGGDVDVI